MRKLFWLSLCLLFLSQSHAQSLRSLLDKGETSIFSHRATLDPTSPENSISAVQMAMSKRLNMHEIDLAESSDGILYLLHDKTLDRTTEATGPINSFDSHYLDEVKLKGTEEKLPRFEDFLTFAKKNQLYLMLDVKEASLDKVIKMVKAKGMLDRIIVLTFSKARAEEALALGERFLLSVLIQEKDDFDYYLCKIEHSYDLAAYLNKDASLELYKQAQSLGLPIVTDVLGAIDQRAQAEGLEVYSEFVRERKPSILVSDYPLQVMASKVDEGSGL